MAKTKDTKPAEPAMVPGEITVAPKTTRITTVSVKIKRELDTGYLPFLRYMHKNSYKQPPFGMRDASKAYIDIFMSAEVGDDEDPDAVCRQLAQQAHAIADRELRNEYPDAFPVVSKRDEPGVTEMQAGSIPEEAYTIQSTEIERKVEDF